MNAVHLRRTAQIWRAGGMIWMIAITLFFAVYDLYFLELSWFLSLIFEILAAMVSLVLFSWSLKTLKLAKRLPAEKQVDEVKQRKMRAEFLIILIIEIAAFNIAPFVLLYFGHIDYVVPVEILICAMHFIPLARIFVMPVYYLLGSVVSMITVLTLLLIPASPKIGNLALIAAIPSVCFIVSNWIVIAHILNDARRYFIYPDHEVRLKIYGQSRKNRISD